MAKQAIAHTSTPPLPRALPPAARRKVEAAAQAHADALAALTAFLDEMDGDSDREEDDPREDNHDREEDYEREEEPNEDWHQPTRLDTRRAIPDSWEDGRRVTSPFGTTGSLKFPARRGTGGAP